LIRSKDGRGPFRLPTPDTALEKELVAISNLIKEVGVKGECASPQGLLLALG
jgi:hypothetical protein